MATETTNYLQAAVKYDGVNDVILSRTGIASVVKNGVGDYTVNLTDGIAANGDVRTVAMEGTVPALAAVSRDNATEYQVRLTATQVATDRILNICFYALTNRG